MSKRFSQDELETVEQHNINSRILEQAGDIAEKLTEMECKLNGIECYVTEMVDLTEISTYTDEAQEIFNVHYDQYVDELYDLLNRQLEIIN
jgi:hypothetical protein